MSSTPHSFHFLLVALAGRLNRDQQDVVDCLFAENRILKAQLNGHRLQLSDYERPRLAVRAKKPGRACLEEVASLVTPDALPRRHRILVARKWTHPPLGHALSRTRPVAAGRVIGNPIRTSGSVPDLFPALFHGIEHSCRTKLCAQFMEFRVSLLIAATCR